MTPFYILSACESCTCRVLDVDYVITIGLSTLEHHEMCLTRRAQDYTSCMSNKDTYNHL